MISELKGPEGRLLGLSIVAAVLAFIIVFKIVRALITGDVGLLLGSILATYAGVVTPWLVVRMLQSPRPSPKPAVSPA